MKIKLDKLKSILKKTTNNYIFIRFKHYCSYSWCFYITILNNTDQTLIEKR